ncbi:MAG: iron-containing redox enzyme family protein [Edaphobacter sp.]|uniref:iron-containing redox enzyme family protein n=1 Tax=Edaphobacter sp. TaxID=1934404 RepID=UPI002382AD0B|nr:iron-containing redox enzyme family protein [Edaphobacter sp.]MDE1176068.1 iron-containing redox enzyme family protein [Edaphobacter sp.]
MSLSHSNVLWSKIRLAEPRLHAATQAFWSHPQLAEILPSFLVQLHRVMKGGIDLMRIARERALSMPGDPVAAIVAEYLEEHILEEKDHDAWLLDDIGTLGISPEEVAGATPLAAVVSLLGAQYFWALNIHPVAVFGYLIVLEGKPPVAAELEMIRRRTGLPASAFRCLHEHADNDPHHIAELNSTLDAMPLTTEQEEYIALSAFQTIDSVAAILEELTSLHAASLQHSFDAPAPAYG